MYSVSNAVVGEEAFLIMMGHKVDKCAHIGGGGEGGGVWGHAYQEHKEIWWQVYQGI